MSRFLKFIGLNALVGVLLLVVLAPGFIVGGVATGLGVSIFENLPDYIKPVNASQASTLWAVGPDGRPVEIARFYEQNRISISYDKISPYFVNAAIGTEDPRFREHNGFDPISFLRASATNVATGGNGPGGSTITMQYVKNSLIEAAIISGDEAAVDAARSRGVDRKLREIRLAIALEQETSKNDIFAGYANLSFFGHQINGVEAASQFYFGKSAATLNIEEGAMLAAMLKSPNDYRPDAPENLERAKGRRDYVIQNEADYCAAHPEIQPCITQAEADAAKARPIKLNITEVPTGCEGNQTFAFFCDYVVWTIRNSPEFGPTQGDREMLLRRGGMDIYTTMNVKMQNAADLASKKWVPVADPSQIGTASVSVEVGTGRVLAMAENRIFDQTQSTEPGHTSVNYAADKAYGGSSGFQSGSTYKLFTLAQWLTSGKKLLDRVDGRVREWNASDFSARCGTLGGTWAPNNIVKEPDNPTVLQATAISENTAFAEMASQLDLCDIKDAAEAFGVHRADGQPLVFYPSSVIGVNELSPVTMAAAVAGIANHGLFCSPIAIDRIVLRSTNAPLTVPVSQCRQAVTPEVAAGITYAMRAVMSGGTGGASNTGDGVALAGKTGTTDSGVHTWMTGFSSAVGTATWVGNVSGSTSLSRILLNKKAGNTVRHDIWRTIMKVANAEYKDKITGFDAPPQDMIDATMITVPKVAGQLPDAAATQLLTADLNTQIQTVTIPSLLPAGQVAKTIPNAGKVVARGTIVKIYVSGGGKAKIPSVGVVGATVADAKATLLSLGFSAVSEPQPSQRQYFVKSSTIAKGLVVGTTPRVGSSAELSSAILLIISDGP
jgi:membrane peptidoglycan carboxypeptidase